MERPNRFTVLARIAGKEVRAYLPNPGKLSYLKKGTDLLLFEAARRGRKLPYEVFLAYDGTVPVIVDSRLANRVFKECLIRGYLPEFSKCVIEKETTIQGRRIDFSLQCENGTFYVEVKSCTYVDQGVAKFPDRPTERGRQHLSLLMGLRSSGYDSYVVFVIERPDAEVFSPFREVDPEFFDVFSDALRAGVQAMAISTFFDRDTKTVYLKKRVPISILP